MAQIINMISHQVTNILKRQHRDFISLHNSTGPTVPCHAPSLPRAQFREPQLKILVYHSNPKRVFIQANSFSHREVMLYSCKGTRPAYNYMPTVHCAHLRQCACCTSRLARIVPICTLCFWVCFMDCSINNRLFMFSVWSNCFHNHEQKIKLNIDFHTDGKPNLTPRVWRRKKKKR